jgi:hypothetical protein
MGVAPEHVDDIMEETTILMMSSIIGFVGCSIMEETTILMMSSAVCQPLQCV